MKENPSAFKHSISPKLVKKTGQALKKVYPDFNETRFNQVSRKLEPLELKARVQVIRDALFESLPKDFKKATRILIKAVEQSDLSGFALWPMTDFIQTYGLEHFDESMAGLYALTQKFTAEFAVRPFIVQNPQKTYALLKTWSEDSNVHVRRLTSECTRPRLPWGLKLKSAIACPNSGIEILEKLKYDNDLYVRKSVANHLNDITKDHPDLVIRTLKKWQNESSEAHLKKIDWIQKHALRSLIKQGYKPALKLMGYGHDALVKIGNLKLNKYHFKLNEVLIFELEIKSTHKKPQKLAIDYVIHYQKANKKISPKVFKLKVIEIKPDETFLLKKNHKLRPVTTRKHYPGLHKIEIQINGQILASQEWTLR